jgi:hypothetical protein
MVAFGAFYIFFVQLFAFSYYALDVIQYNADAADQAGDYLNMGGMFFAQFTASYRQSLGDFNFLQFKYLGVQKSFMFIIWIAQTTLMFFLLTNFAIQIAEGGYASAKDV